MDFKASKAFVTALKIVCLLSTILQVTQAMPFREKRIVNGTELPAHSWPWLASLQFYGPQHGYQALQGLPHLCGGVLIDPNWVLTTAHCFLPQMGEGLNVSSNWKVMLGDHNRVTNESTEQLIDVERYYSHEDFQLFPFTGDIALVKLTRSATVTEAVRPITLDRRRRIRDGTLCRVAGWGQLESADDDVSLYGKGSMVPLWVDIHKVSTRQCREAYSNVASELVIDERVLCYGSDEGKDSCQGDSGTSLVCWVKGRPVLTGLMSLGQGCAREGKPGLYTNVPYYRTDILRNIRSLEGQQRRRRENV